MKMPYKYLEIIPNEIIDMTIFPYAEEQWSVELRIQEGRKLFELKGYLYGDLKKKRVELTEEQIEHLESLLEDAMKKAELRFGSFD